jgi:transposase
MRFVPLKRVEQQDLQALHRVRERLIKARTALVNEIRGLLSEYGIVLPQGMSKFGPNIEKLSYGATCGIDWPQRAFCALL